MTTMLVHDTRLAGTAPTLAPNIYKVNANTRLQHALGWIARYASSQGGLDQLLIMCHGMTGGVHDTNAGMSTADLGFGLQFCKESLSLTNVSGTAVLDGFVREIILYACGPARTRAGFQNTIADGTRFCGELAAWTGADVIAPTDTQFYRTGPPKDILRSLFGIGPQDIIDFGEWEGRLYRFSPDGSRTPAN